jgi:hypothetical protein
MDNHFLGNCRSPLRLAFVFTSVAALCFACFASTYAVMPAPDGGYSGENTAEGTNALFSLTTGVWNTASGFEALKSNSTGSVNTASGFHALFKNLGGVSNTAVGSQALLNSTTGSHNIAVGGQSGVSITTGSFNIDIGNAGTTTDDSTIRIGREGIHDHTFIAGISGVPIADGASVVVKANGQLGIASISSARFKDEIKPMDKASQAIFALKPVTFHYKKEIDSTGIPQFGLVAEEVEKVNPDLVTRDPEGKLYTVRYDAVNAMLLNEFLKEHRKVQELEKQVETLTAGLQKVSAQVEASKPAPQVVLGNQ